MCCASQAAPFSKTGGEQILGCPEPSDAVSRCKGADLDAQLFLPVPHRAGGCVRLVANQRWPQGDTGSCVLCHDMRDYEGAEATGVSGLQLRVSTFAQLWPRCVLSELVESDVRDSCGSTFLGTRWATTSCKARVSTGYLWITPPTRDRAASIQMQTGCMVTIR